MNLAGKIIRRIRKVILRYFRPRHWLRQVWHSPRLMGDRYTPIDNTRVTVVADRADLFPGWPLRRSLHGQPRLRRVQVSLISTTFNEGENARRVMAGILAQSRLPDEIIIVDGGSQDGTAEGLRAAASQAGLPVHILVEPGANISRGRNLATARAAFPVIAALDFGCLPRPDWLEKLVAPFELDPETEVVAGWYESLGPDGQIMQRMGWPSLEGLEPQGFLPSSRSIAFTKAAWEKVGGYPEWLTLTGEDTYFDLELKRYTSHWAFVPEATVQWKAPASPQAYWKKLSIWSVGDGEAGLNTRYYRGTLLDVLAVLSWLLLAIGAGLASALIGSPALAVGTGLWFLAGIGIIYWKARRAGYSATDFLWEFPVPFFRLTGFLRGWRRRRIVDYHRFQTLKGVFFILSGVPIDDVGGGARCTQVALELLSRHWLVIFLNKFPRYESADLRLQIRHPNLWTAPLRFFSLRRFLRDYGGLFARKPSGALVEFPLKGFIPLIRELRKAGVHVIYDLLDNWDTSLGKKWYIPQVEQAIIDASDSLVATAPSLATRLEVQSGRPVTLLPNAVNLRLFDHRRAYPRPLDLPPAEWIITYTGALWGDWLDWDLLIHIAQAYPQAAVVAIGDYVGQCQNPPPNLHFLGLKAQRDLPAYLAHAHVALIPWKVNDITRATSPLKVYEYLAMHKPVVVPDLPLLAYLPFVVCTKDESDFIRSVEQARHWRVEGDELVNFLARNSWEARLDQILGLLRENGSATG